MKNDNLTSVTKGNSESSICRFPYCETVLYRDNKSGFCSVHEKRLYQQLLQDIGKLKQDTEKLKKLSTPRRGSILFQSKNIRPPYEIVNKAGFRFLVEKGKKAKSVVELSNEPDLFIRFCELPEDEGAYLDFVSRYGLFGFYEHDHQAREAYGINWAKNEEPIQLIALFHKGLKHSFGVAKDILEGKRVKRSEVIMARQWLETEFWRSSDIYSIPKFSSEDLKPSGSHLMAASTLVGALLLQFYIFLRLGPKLKRCALPGCTLLTSRPKFCSKKHGNLYRVWKKRGVLSRKEQK